MKAVQRAAAIGLVATALVSGSAIGQSPAAVDLGAATGEVKVLMIGYPDQDSIDPATGNTVPGVNQLKAKFEAAHPDITLTIINIPFGSGATGYSPKTEAMIQANEACVYDMPGALDFGHRGVLFNLDTLVAQDPTFQDVWEGRHFADARGWTPDNPDALLYLPYDSGERVIHWDSKLFADWGVEPLSENPTLDEIKTKAIATTGTDPVTGEQTYGYWYQGKYAVWQFLAIAHAMGADWGSVGADGKWQIDWNTPEYVAALQWFVDMAKYAPAGGLAADAMPPGFLTDQNVVSIIPEGESGYFVLPMISDPTLAERFRTSHNLKGADGLGGLNTVAPLTMAATCENKLAAWELMKWLAGSPEAER